MCKLCDNIDNKFGVNNGYMDYDGYYIKSRTSPCSVNTWYYLCYYTIEKEEDEEIYRLNYCPNCGRKLFEDKYWHGTTKGMKIIIKEDN